MLELERMALTSCCKNQQFGECRSSKVNVSPAGTCKWNIQHDQFGTVATGLDPSWNVAVGHENKQRDM